MALAFHFREKILGPWDTAHGFVVGEFDYLYAGLLALGPLSGSLATLDFANTGKYPATAMLTTDATGQAAFTQTLPGPLQFPAALTITPATLAAAVHNYTPAGGDTSAQVRLTGAAAGTTLTGMNAPLATGGLYRLLVNIGTPVIALTHQDSNSLAANRFATPGSVTYSLAANQAAWCWYDPVSRWWRIVGK